MSAQINSLMRELHLDEIWGIDFETFYCTKSKYSLKNPTLSNTEYIIDPRFKAHMVSIQRHSWKKAKWLTIPQFVKWLRTINWARAGYLAHHTQFDGLISSHHFGHKAAFYFDTLSMSRPLVNIKVGGSLDNLTRAFGGAGKVKVAALEATDGVRDLTPAQLAELGPYACDDVQDTWMVFRAMLDYLPLQELKIIDRTIKMYVDPTVLLDRPAIDDVLVKDTANKVMLVKKLKLAKTYEESAELLASADKFADVLRAAGVEPPTKKSEKKSEKAGHDVIVYAMSKQDQEFKDLLAHPDKRVRNLMDARFAVTSNNMASRCKRLAARAHIGPQPVYLNYYGARPGRWSGGDLVNWQNLSSKRKEGGAELRASVYAPEGYVLLIADLSQIEARLNAWDAGQEDKLDVFRAYDKIIGYDDKGKPIRSGPDVYRYTAAGIYNVHIDKIVDAQRQIGKISDLSLGYQAGAPRFAKTLRLGSMGPPVDITDSLAKDIHTAWRRTNDKIVRNWKLTQNNFRDAVLARTTIPHGAVSYEGAGDVAFMHGPGGASIRYDDVQFSEDGLSYLSEYFPLKKGGARKERTRLYGGILVQNKLEHLGRRLIADQMIELCEYLPKAKLVMSTHDEAVLAVPVSQAKKALAAANRIMSTSPYWAPNLPIAVDAHISPRYDK